MSHPPRSFWSRPSRKEERPAPAKLSICATPVGIIVSICFWQSLYHRSPRTLTHYVPLDNSSSLVDVWRSSASDLRSGSQWAQFGHFTGSMSATRTCGRGHALTPSSRACWSRWSHGEPYRDGPLTARTLSLPGFISDLCVPWSPSIAFRDDRRQNRSFHEHSRSSRGWCS